VHFIDVKNTNRGNAVGSIRLNDGTIVTEGQTFDVTTANGQPITDSSDYGANDTSLHIRREAGKLSVVNTTVGGFADTEQYYLTLTVENGSFTGQANGVSGFNGLEGNGQGFPETAAWEE
jgi:hypothetical protein